MNAGTRLYKMSIGDLPKILPFGDTWYKAVMSLGIMGFIIALIFDIKAISNIQLLLLSLGLFFIGLGEWKNRKKLSYIKEANAYTGPAALITQTVRAPDLVGVLLVALGFLLLIVSIGSIVYSALTGEPPVVTPTP